MPGDALAQAAWAFPAAHAHWRAAPSRRPSSAQASTSGIRAPPPPPSPYFSAGTAGGVLNLADHRDMLLDCFRTGGARLQRWWWVWRAARARDTRGEIGLLMADPRTVPAPLACNRRFLIRAPRPPRSGPVVRPARPRLRCRREAGAGGAERGARSFAFSP